MKNNFDFSKFALNIVEIFFGFLYIVITSNEPTIKFDTYILVYVVSLTVHLSSTTGKGSDINKDQGQNVTHQSCSGAEVGPLQ